MSELKLTKGENILIKKLQELLDDARNGEFGDFTNVKYATPKMVLRNKFLELAQDVVEGVFD